MQVFKHIANEEIFVVDINSMYPAMLLKPLPWNYVDTVNIIDQDHLL